MVLSPSPSPFVKEEPEKYLGLDCIFIGTDQANETVSNNKNMMEKLLDNININLFFEKITLNMNL